jgi:hypothetical protein
LNNWKEQSNNGEKSEEDSWTRRKWVYSAGKWRDRQNADWINNYEHGDGLNVSYLNFPVKLACFSSTHLLGVASAQYRAKILFTTHTWNWSKKPAKLRRHSMNGWILWILSSLSTPKWVTITQRRMLCNNFYDIFYPSRLPLLSNFLSKMFRRQRSGKNISPTKQTDSTHHAKPELGVILAIEGKRRKKVPLRDPRAKFV